MQPEHAISSLVSVDDLIESQQALDDLTYEQLPYLQQLGEELLRGERLDEETLETMQREMDRAYIFADLTLSFIEIEDFGAEVEKTGKLREQAQSILKELIELKRSLSNVEAIRIKRN